VAFPPVKYSLRWYGKVLDHLRNVPGIKPDLAGVFLVSLRVAILAALGSAIAGVLAAYGLHRYRFRGIAVVRQFFLVPLMFPQIVTGVALLVWFSQVPALGLFTRLVLGHLVLTLPYVIITVSATLEATGVDLEEAAIGLGASRARAFVLVTLPLIRQGVIAGSIFGFIISMNTFTLSYFLYSVDAKPLPMWIFEYMAYFLDPTLAAISSVLILLTLLVAVTLNRLVGISRLAAR
jgi:putative spermidine/putrescine transport system permease protein